MTAPLDRPLRRDASRNRDRLLKAARELFAERGLDVPMDDIADRAGVGVGTAYRRFANRDAIVDALFEDRMADYLALAEAALVDPDPWTGLVTFLERSLAMQADDRGLKELLMRDRRVLDRVASARERVLSLIERVIVRAHEAGALRPGVTAEDFHVFSHMLGAANDLAPDLWRRYLPLLLDGLRAGDPLPGEPVTAA